MMRPEIHRLELPEAYLYSILPTIRAFQKQLPEFSKHPRTLAEFQLAQLKKLLHVAAYETEYYAKVLPTHFHESNLIELLDQLPLLNRKVLARQFYEMSNRNIDLKYCYVSHTSGTSGPRLRVLHDYSHILYQQALLSAYLSEYEIGGDDFESDRASITRISYFPDSRSITYLLYLLNNTDYFKLNLLQLSDLEAFMIEQNPTLLSGLPEHLIHFAHTNPQTIRQLTALKAVVSAGNYLKDSTRHTLEELFAVPVIDVYAMTELGYIGIQKAFTKDYHVPPHLIVEIIKEDGKRASANEAGEIVVTDLHNIAMPLIRYQTGDYGAWISQTPSQLRLLEGRVNENMLVQDGQQLHPYLFLKELGSMGFEDYLVVQKSYTELLIQYVAINPPETIEAQIKSIFNQLSQGNLQIEIQRLRHIERGQGKKRQFIQKIGGRHAD